MAEPRAPRPHSVAAYCASSRNLPKPEGGTSVDARYFLRSSSSLRRNLRRHSSCFWGMSEARYGRYFSSFSVMTSTYCCRRAFKIDQGRDLVLEFPFGVLDGSDHDAL